MQSLQQIILFCSDRGYLNSPNETPLDPENLPEGKCPIWIQKGKNANIKDVLQKVQEDHITKDYDGKSVTVIYKEESQDVKDFCWSYNWKYVHRDSIYGSEDDVVIVMVDNPGPEYISRARNGLIIITNHG